MVIVLDIDGTISDGTHRAHHLEGEKPNWEKFLEPSLVEKDTPIAVAKRCIQNFVRLKYRIVFLTGRNESLRDTTTRWLLEHFDISVGFENLLMRPAGNLLKATEYKREQVINIRQDYGPELLFIDDDKYMHKVYEEFGIALHAPECWTTMFPDHGELAQETLWRK